MFPRSGFIALVERVLLSFGGLKARALEVELPVLRLKPFPPSLPSAVAPALGFPVVAEPTLREPIDPEPMLPRDADSVSPRPPAVNPLT